MNGFVIPLNSYATYGEGSTLFHIQLYIIMQYIFQKLQIFIHGRN